MYRTITGIFNNTESCLNKTKYHALHLIFENIKHQITKPTMYLYFKVTNDIDIWHITVSRHQ